MVTLVALKPCTGANIGITKILNETDTLNAIRYGRLNFGSTQIFNVTMPGLCSTINNLFLPFLFSFTDYWTCCL